MDNRNFHVFITPATGGADRHFELKCLNFGEAEGLATGYMGDGEFISRIEQEFPTVEKDRTLFQVSRPDNSDDTTLIANDREDAKRQAREILGGDPEWYIVEPIKTETEHLADVEKALERARQSRKNRKERQEDY